MGFVEYANRANIASDSCVCEACVCLYSTVRGWFACLRRLSIVVFINTFLTLDLPPSLSLHSLLHFPPVPARALPLVKRASSSMAQRHRPDVEPTPPPSFLSLPDIAHATIASFLPDGDLLFGGSRLRVSAVSRALFESYGASLTRIRLRLRNFTGSSIDNLAALLRRNEKLVEVTAEGRDSRALPSHYPRLLPAH